MPGVELTEYRALHLNPNIEFLLNSMSVSFDLQYYLQGGSQTNNRVIYIAEKLKSTLSKPNFVKEKYEEIEKLGRFIQPISLHIAKKNEFARLKNSLIRSQNDEVRYWELMEYFLTNFAVRAVPPSELN